MIIWMFAILLIFGFGIFWLGYKTETYPTFWISGVIFLIISGSVYIEGITIKSGETTIKTSECIFPTIESSEETIDPDLTYNNLFTDNNTVNSAGSQTTITDTGDNIDHYISFNNSQYLQLADNYINATSFTISFWANLENTSDSYDYLFGMHQNWGTMCGFRIRVQDGSNEDNLQIELFNETDSFLEQSDDSFITYNEWHMYTIISRNVSGTPTLEYYLDGVSFGVDDTYSNFINPCANDWDTWIGSTYGGTFNTYGLMDDVRMYIDAISESEVLNIYNEGRSGAVDELINISNAITWNFCPEMNETTVSINNYETTPIGSSFLNGLLFLVMGIFSILCGVIYATPKKDRDYN